MTVYTKTITAGLALLLAGAPLVGTVSADNIANSNGTVSFSDQDGSLVLASADNVTFQNQDLSNISDFTPDASNGTTGKVTLEQTSANPSVLIVFKFNKRVTGITVIRTRWLQQKLCQSCIIQCRYQVQ